MSRANAPAPSRHSEHTAGIFSSGKCIVIPGLTGSSSWHESHEAGLATYNSEDGDPVAIECRRRRRGIDAFGRRAFDVVVLPGDATASLDTRAGGAWACARWPLRAFARSPRGSPAPNRLRGALREAVCKARESLLTRDGGGHIARLFEDWESRCDRPANRAAAAGNPYGTMGRIRAGRIGFPQRSRLPVPGIRGSEC